MNIYWLLPAIIALGIITTFEDIRDGRIRNIWILLAVSYSAAIHIILEVFDLDYLLSLALSFGAGYALWRADLWSAGDAKLFVAFTSLLPAGSYLGISELIPSLTLLVNTFLPVSVALLVMGIRNWRKRLSFSPLGFIEMLCAIAALSWPLGLLAPFLGYGWQPLAALIYLATRDIIRKEYLIVMAVSRLALDPSIWSLGYLIALVLTAAVISLFISTAHAGRTESLPFAPFLFAGALLTLLLGTDLVGFIMGLSS
jgi:hypothetical protein